MVLSMKLRIICLILAIALLSGLTGCAPADQRAFQRACDLMDAGEYEAAIEAFSAIGMYQDIAEKIEEAQGLLEEENTRFLYGTWVNLHTGTLLTFSKDGKGTLFAANGEETAFTYTCDGKTVAFTAPAELLLKTEKEDGVLHLKDQEGLYDLVSRKDYEKMGPVTVEITPDNWETYFEGRQAQDVGLDSDGFVNHRELGYGIFLKEEYLDRLDAGSYDGAVWFEITFEYTPYLLEGNLDSDFYSLKETRLPRELDAYRGRFSTSLPVNHRGYQQWRSPESDFNNAACCFLGADRLEWEGNVYMMMIDKVEIRDVRGTLVLNP